MGDIVNTLREVPNGTAQEAADEIERLRAELKAWKDAKDPFGFEYAAILHGVKVGLEAAATAVREKQGPYVGEDCAEIIRAIDPATVKEPSDG